MRSIGSPSVVDFRRKATSLAAQYEKTLLFSLQNDFLDLCVSI